MFTVLWLLCNFVAPTSVLPDPVVPTLGSVISEFDTNVTRDQEGDDDNEFVAEVFETNRERFVGERHYINRSSLPTEQIHRNKYGFPQMINEASTASREKHLRLLNKSPGEIVVWHCLLLLAAHTTIRRNQIDTSQIEAVYKLNWLESAEWTPCAGSPSRRSLVGISCGYELGDVDLIRTEHHLGGEVNCTSESSRLICTSSYELPTTAYNGPVFNADIVFSCRGVSNSQVAAEAEWRFNYQCDVDTSRGKNISGALRLLIHDTSVENFTLGSGCRYGYPSVSGFCVDGDHCGAESFPPNECSLMARYLMVKQLLPIPHLSTAQLCPLGFSIVLLGFFKNNRSSEFSWSFSRISDDLVLQRGSSVLEAGQPYRSPLGCLPNDECYFLSTIDAKADSYAFGFEEQLGGRWIEFNGALFTVSYTGKVSQTLAGLSTNCAGAPWLRAVYRVEWRHFVNNCNGVIPRLRLDCSNGGVVLLRNGVLGTCGRLVGSSIDCEYSSFDLERTFDLVYNQTASFSCTGYASVPLPIVTSIGQKMTCRSSENIGSHSIRVSYFDFSRGMYVEGGPCTKGTMRNGFCTSEGSCLAETGDCNASSDDIVARWASPLPEGAELDVTALFTPPAVLESTLMPTLSLTPNPASPTLGPTSGPRSGAALVHALYPTLQSAMMCCIFLVWTATDCVF